MLNVTSDCPWCGSPVYMRKAVPMTILSRMETGAVVREDLCAECAVKVLELEKEVRECRTRAGGI